MNNLSFEDLPLEILVNIAAVADTPKVWRSLQLTMRNVWEYACHENSQNLMKCCHYTSFKGTDYEVWYKQPSIDLGHSCLLITDKCCNVPNKLHIGSEVLVIGNCKCGHIIHSGAYFGENISKALKVFDDNSFDDIWISELGMKGWQNWITEMVRVTKPKGHITGINYSTFRPCQNLIGIEERPEFFQSIGMTVFLNDIEKINNIVTPIIYANEDRKLCLKFRVNEKVASISSGDMCIRSKK